MAGAALGFLSGAAIGALGQYGKQKQQQKSLHDQALLDLYSKNPSLATDKDAQQFLSKSFGKDVAQGFLQLGNLHQQMTQNIQGDLGAGGGTQPQGQPAPSGLQQASVQGQPQGFDDQIKAIDANIQKALNVQAKYGADPEYANYSHIVDSRLRTLTEQKNTLIRQQQQQQHDREWQQNQERMQQNAQVMQSIAASNAESNNMMKVFMMNMDREKNDDARRRYFQSASQTLATQTKNIGAMLSSATPADPKTVKTLLDQRNAAAKSLQKQADKYGIEYDPDQFKPLTIEDVPGVVQRMTGIGLFGGTPTLAAASPTAKDVSGELGKAAGPPEGAVAEIRNKAGEVTGYRMKDGSIQRPSAGGK